MSKLFDIITDYGTIILGVIIAIAFVIGIIGVIIEKVKNKRSIKSPYGW